MMKHHSYMKIATAGRSLLRRQNHRPLSNRSPSSSSSPSSSVRWFSGDTETTVVAPTVSHGPFGTGGTVVGFSKFDGVRAAFEENFARRLELGSQLVVYQNGTKIVDLYGYAPETEAYNDGAGYDGDTLQCVFSSGKNTEAIAVAMLVDRGLLNYDDLVAEHWPEFGCRGKESVTVSDVMRHAGGVPFVIDPDRPAKTDLITPDEVEAVEVLEAKLSGATRYPPASADSQLCYHAFTRGFLVNAILRRVDPAGRSLSRFWREEVTDPLSTVSDDPVRYFCGLPVEEQSRYGFADIDDGNMLYRIPAEIIPGLFGRGPNPECGPFAALAAKPDVRRDAGISWLGFPPKFHNVNSPRGRALEVSSAGMLANARSVAVVQAAGMLNGSFRGVRLTGEDTVEASMAGFERRIDHSMDVAVSVSRGGYGSFADTIRGGDGGDEDRYHTRAWHPDDASAYGDLVGWGGLGGSLALVDRSRNLVFVYCMNAFGLNLLGGPRTRRILLELQRSLAAAGDP